MKVDSPIRLESARAWRTYHGGRILDEMHGVTSASDTHFPEDWIISTVRAINAGREDVVEGLNVVSGTETTLKDAIAADPEAMMGAAHVAKWGGSPAVLVKLIDAAERLGVQGHPDKAKAMEFFKSPFGKTECWHIVGGRTIGGERPCVYMGFKPGITAAKWRDVFDRQDIPEMLGLLHCIEVKPGDTFIIAGGVPHAIGAGCLLMEIQEPTDCTFAPSEGDVLIEVQKRTGRVFQMGNQRRSSAAYSPAVEALRAGIIGDIRYGRCWYQNNRQPIGPRVPAPVPDWLDWDLWQGPAPRSVYRTNVVHYNWHWSFQYGTGEIANSAVHFIDVARWAMGLDLPNVVSAVGCSCTGDVGWEWPGLQMLSMAFPGDKLITWEGVSSLPGKKPMDIYGGAVILGSEGSMYFHPHDYVILYDKDGAVTKEWHPTGIRAEDCTSDVPSAPGVPWKPKLDTRHILNFFDAVRANDPSRVHSPVVDSVRSSLMTHLGNLSIRSGMTLHVDPSTGKPREAEAMRYWDREYEPGWAHG